MLSLQLRAYVAIRGVLRIVYDIMRKSHLSSTDHLVPYAPSRI